MKAAIPFRIIRGIEGDGENARVEDFQVILIQSHRDLIVLITNLQIPHGLRCVSR